MSFVLPIRNVTRAGDYADCSWTWRAIAQMKPIISRAIAVVTITFGLPLATRRRYRAQRRTCAFHAVSRIPCGKSSIRSCSFRLTLHAVGPGSLNQRPASLTIPGLRDATPSNTVAG